MKQPDPHTSVLASVSESLIALDIAKAAYDAAAATMTQASAVYEAALAAVKAARSDLDAHLNARVS